jgi:hypothetical protein
MLKKILTLLLSSFLLFNINTFSQIKEVIKVSGAFMDFNKAVEKKDGEEAIKFVSESTKAYFNSILPYIKNYASSGNDSNFIKHKDVIDWLHSAIASEKIESIQENQIFSFLVSNGIFQKLNFGRFHPGAITINGENGKALLTTFSTSEKSECTVSKEGKKWKINLDSIINYLINNVQ